MRTAALSQSASNDVMHFEKRIRVTEGIWRYALSDDGRRVAYAGSQSMNVFVVDIEAGTTTEMQAPQLNSKSTIAWHPDGEHFAVFGARKCLIISAKEGRCVREIDNPEPARFGQAAMFSRDGRTLFVEDSAQNKGTIVIELDLVTSEARELRIPDRGKQIQFASAGSGRFQRCQEDLYSTVTTYSTGRKDSLGTNIFGNFGLSLEPSTVSENKTMFRIDIGAADYGESTGFGLYSVFLYSRPTDSYVFYLPPYNSKVNPATYVALHTFKSDGERLRSFANFDLLQQRCRKGIDVHPRQPWVITTISVSEPEPSGQIIIWDLRTGQIVQRLTSGLSAFDPIISPDGKTMITQDPHIAVFHFD